MKEVVAGSRERMKRLFLSGISNTMKGKENKDCGFNLPDYSALDHLLLTFAIRFLQITFATLLSTNIMGLA